MNGGQRTCRAARAVELAEDRHDAAGAVDVFHVHVALGGRDLAQHRNLAGQPVDVVHGEVDLALMGAASMCSTVLVEPPMAISSVMAFSNAA
jgi:7-keto-8-aminopelargonate synthetase-like enzyme